MHEIRHFLKTFWSYIKPIKTIRTIRMTSQTEAQHMVPRNGNFKPPPELDFDEPRWNEWKKSFEMYRKLTGLDKQDQEMQAITLKYCMGIKCMEIITTLNLTEQEENSYNTLMEKLSQYFKPKRNELRLRRNFGPLQITYNSLVFICCTTYVKQTAIQLSYNSPGLLSLYNLIFRCFQH